jgi:hypothetical protein
MAVRLDNFTGCELDDNLKAFFETWIDGFN